MAERVALVTGGTRGIGLGVALALAREGWALAVNGVRPPEEAAPALEALREAGADPLYIPADIGDAEARSRLLGAVRERWGRLDALVNNAGIAPAVRADLLEAGEESFDRLLRVNLRGPHFLTQAIARWMIERWRTGEGPRGGIVFVTSVSAKVASVNRGEYCISKAGLSMAARLWAVRLAEFGIPVWEVRPGVVRTDMTAGVTALYDRLIADGLLLESRWGEPQDVGRAVAMLLRGDLPYASGAVLTLDGGLTVPRL